MRVRLPDLIAAAHDQWGRLPTGRRLTARQVRQTVQVHQATLETYLAGNAAKYRFEILGRLCWFFGCSIDLLLAVQRGDQPLPPVVLGRSAPPAAYPPAGSGAIRVLNFLPGEVALHLQRVRAATDWQREAVLQLAAGGRGAVEQLTLRTVLAVLDRERVSDLLDIQCDLTASDPQATDLGAAIRIVEPRPQWLTQWDATVRQWRVLAEQFPAPGAVTPVDIAAVRALGPQLVETYLERPDALAAGLGIRPGLLVAILQGTVRPEIGAEVLPEAVVRYLAAVAPRDWHAPAAAAALAEVAG
jgi:DNA-binding Xre family transcriptional regulator